MVLGILSYGFPIKSPSKMVDLSIFKAMVMSTLALHFLGMAWGLRETQVARDRKLGLGIRNGAMGSPCLA